MTIYKKPDLKVFGANAKPTEIAEFEDLLRGWGITIEKTNGIPPMEWFNYLFNRLDGNINYILQNGITEYDTNLEYPQNAVVKSNGKLYLCLRQNTNKPLSNGAYWELLIKNATTSQGGVVQLSSSVTSTDETKASTLKATKTAYDKAVQADNNANTRVKIDGSTAMTGNLVIEKGTTSVAQLKAKDCYLNLSSDNSSFFSKTQGSFYLTERTSSAPQNVVGIPNKTGTILLDVDLSDDILSKDNEIPASIKAVSDLNYKLSTEIGNKVNKTKNLNKEDLDDVREEGFFIQGTRSNATSERHYPKANTGGTLIVTRTVLGWAQYFKPGLGNSELYYRDMTVKLDNQGRRKFSEWQQLLAQKQDLVQTGTIQAFASDKVKNGYLKCDGGLYSTTTYAELFKEIGYTWGGSGSRFAVPNLTDKARFLRSSGNSLKVGTYQNDAIRNIKGDFYFAEEINVNANGVFSVDKTYTSKTNRTSGGGHNATFTFDASRVVPTADENRPYSAVVAYWIKY